MFRQFLNILILLLVSGATLYSQVTPETQGYRDDELGNIYSFPIYHYFILLVAGWKCQVVFFGQRVMFLWRILHLK